MVLDYVVVFITVPSGKGEELAKFIVDNRLGACVNIISGVKSVYRWKGEIVRDEEELLIIKTKINIFSKLINKIKEIHPYEVPEIIAMPLVAGNENYLEWVSKEVEER